MIDYENKLSVIKACKFHIYETVIDWRTRERLLKCLRCGFFVGCELND